MELDEEIAGPKADSESGDLKALKAIDADLSKDIKAFLLGKRLEFKPGQIELVASQVAKKCYKLWKSGKKILAADAIAENPSYKGPGSPIAITPEAAKAFEATNTTQFARYMATFLGHSIPIISQVLAVGQWAKSAYKVFTLNSNAGALKVIGEKLSTSAASQLVILCSAPVVRNQLRDETQRLVSKTLHLVTAFVDMTGLLSPAIGAGTAAHSIYLNIRLTKFLHDGLDKTNNDIEKLGPPMPKPGTEPTETPSAELNIETFKAFPVLACFLMPPIETLGTVGTSASDKAKSAKRAINERFAGVWAKATIDPAKRVQEQALVAEKYQQKRDQITLQNLWIAEGKLMKTGSFLGIPPNVWMGLPEATALGTDRVVIERFEAVIELSKIAGTLREGYPIHLLAPGESGYEDKKDLAKRGVLGAGSLVG